MKQGLSPRVSARLALKQRVDPRLVLKSQILQLNSFELEQAVSVELEENPALTKIDEEFEPVSREEILKHVAPQELRPSAEGREFQRSLPNDETTPDWLDLTASNDSLWDHLRGQLLPQLPADLQSIGLYIIASVNERGYLITSPEEAALDCNASLEEAEFVISLLRKCEPSGVGAFDLRDCLALQLQSPQSDAEKLARAILKSSWDELVQRNVRAIQRKFKAEESLVNEALDVITGLSPFPGEGFSAHGVVLGGSKSVGAQPDVSISLDPFGWVIEVHGPSPFNIRIDREYERRYIDLNSKRSAPKDERRHVMEFVERAQSFLDALESRRKQLALIASYLAERQAGFVSTGELRFLMPLTRAELAKDLGLHESTVSRATNGKYIQINTGEVVSFDLFFKPALRVQKMIEEILAHENPDNPMSDQDIAERLASQGIHIARRTVNKYRSRQRLLSSHRRRTA